VLFRSAAYEVARFVGGRLRAAGRFATWPEPEAILRLGEACAGVPRDLIMLAGAASFLADLDRAPRLSVQHVEHAAAIAAPGGTRVLHVDTPARRPSGSAWLMPGLRIAAACAGLGFVVLTSWGARWVGTQAQLAQIEQPAAPPAASTSEPVVAAQPDVEQQEDTVDANVESDVGVATGGTDAQDSGSQPGLASLGSFRGPVKNETLRLTGKLALDLSLNPLSGSVRARFHAWNGLLGTGQLRGSVTRDGRVILSGQLLMGKNPFLCTLTGTIQGDHFTGSAEFVRPWGGRIAHSNFNLLRT